MSTIKEQLYKSCQEFLNDRLKAVEGIIENVQESLQSETKSSAGDKHETGRAMLQLEREKAGKQLAEIQKQQELLNKVSTNNSKEIVRLGSLVITDKSNFYIAISKGLIIIENNNYFAVSPKAPIGQLLLGKKVGDIVEFNGKRFHIQQIK